VKYLLDTHVVIWWLMDDRKAGAKRLRSFVGSNAVLGGDRRRVALKSGND
jgi:hypothetical protein